MSSKSPQYTDREELVQQYQQRHEQAVEKSADWYVYGHAYGLLAGSGPLSWVRKKLVEVREQCRQYANDFGFYPDSTYGTYGGYIPRVAHRDKLKSK